MSDGVLKIKEPQAENTPLQKLSYRCQQAEGASGLCAG